MFNNRLILIVTVMASLVGCKEAPKTVEISPEYLHGSVKNLSNVIVHDIFSPPVASRIYAYPCLAAYEIMAAKDSSYKSLAGQLHEFEGIPRPKNQVVYELAALEAFNTVGKTLIFSEDMVMTYKDSILTKIRNSGLDKTIYDQSIAYGDQVADAIIKYSSSDNYKESRTFSKHTVSDEPDKWEPTPPAYMEAIEPHWNEIRTFVIDSSNQFMPVRPAKFSLDNESTFFKEALQVFNVGNELDDEQSEIASFWDCNPFVMNIHGHVMFATKKITPGGHWMGIAKIAGELSKADFARSAQAYTLTSIALFDGFISAWDEKYRSDQIRPETVINRYIDEEWTPFLQTPPFPEYPSAHSVISGAVGEALTSIYGNKFQFTDSTEAVYGLTMRKFDSFHDAASEAAISRLYGGIHFREAVENGLVQGRNIGNFIVDKLKFKED